MGAYREKVSIKCMSNFYIVPSDRLPINFFNHNHHHQFSILYSIHLPRYAQYTDTKKNNQKQPSINTYIHTYKQLPHQINFSPSYEMCTYKMQKVMCKRCYREYDNNLILYRKCSSKFYLFQITYLTTYLSNSSFNTICPLPSHAQSVFSSGFN